MNQIHEKFLPLSFNQLKRKKKGVDFREKSLKTSLKSRGELGAQTQAS